MERRGNGFGTLVSKGEGKPWLAKWLCHGKTYYKSTGEVDRKKALKVLEKLTRPYRESDDEAVIANLELMLKRLKSKADKSKKLAIKDIWNEFSKTLWQSDIEAGTLKVYETGMNHLQSWMNGKALDASGIDVKLAELYLKELSNDVGAATYNTRLSLFRRVWRNLPSEYGIDKTIWDGFKKKSGTKSSREVLTKDELGKLILNAPTNDIKLLILIGAYTGLRIGDSANLKWSDIDFNSCTMKVLPQKTKKHMDAPITIPLHPRLRDELKKVYSIDATYVSESNATDYKTGKLNDVVMALFKTCGIETSRKVDGKTKLIKGFHSLRHTFVSMALNECHMSAFLVQKIVGHSTVNMTEHYFHESAAKASEGISQMPDLIDVA